MKKCNDGESPCPITPEHRAFELQEFIGCVCVGNTGRLGICTHVLMDQYRLPTCAGFGLDGKGNWTSGEPTKIATAEDHFALLAQRFDGRNSYHG